MCAREPSTGYQGKAVALSSDGGRTWATQANCLYVPPRVPPGCEALDFGYLGQVDAVSSTRAFLAGGRLPLLVTDDGGRRWVTTVPVLGDSGGGTRQVVFFDPAHGFVLGDDPNNDEVPTLWVTADGGRQWSSVVSSATRAPTTPAAGPGASNVPACTSLQPSVTAGHSVAGLGHFGVPVFFQNVGTQPCELSGYPGVAALDASGDQVLRATRTPSGYLGGLWSGQAPAGITLLPPKARRR